MNGTSPSRLLPIATASAMFIGIAVLIAMLLEPVWREPLVLAAKPNLIVQDEDTTAWMPINNTFAGPEQDTDWNYWAGVLFQLGDYEHGDRTFQRVELYSKSTLVDTYTRGDFTWINIVSRFGLRKPPMNLDHAFLLYPNGKPSVPIPGTCVSGKCTAPHANEGEACTVNSDCDEINECVAVEACADRECLCDPSVSACDDPAQLDTIAKSCLRYRKIHRRMNLDSDPAIITYWQGRPGYSMEARQQAGKGGLHNRYEFFFNKEFTVEVYKADTSGWAMTPVKTYGFGDIDRIEIWGIPGPPTHGDHEDPAWPSRP